VLIHIIEDDTDILVMLEIYFKMKGYQVFADFNGNHFDPRNQPCPDIYLVDIKLIGKNGAELCKIIKKECDHIPVILMSANPDIEKAASECEADAFFQKPFEMDQLLSTVNKLTA
jgi:DNA-binding response OmpR family regulator